MFLPHSLIIIVTCVLGGAKQCIKDGTTEHCYQIVDTNITWNEAFNVCKHDGGMLIIIESDEEQNVIAGQMRNRKFTVNGLWIGSDKLHPEAQRVWANGDKFTYQNWAKGEPNGTQAGAYENCAEISTDNMKWNDKACSHKRGYICENTHDCYTETTRYTGQQSITISGRICQAWSLNTPHSHSYHNDSLFPDGNEYTAANFCRNPSWDGYLWCYTVDPAKRWEECPIWSCKMPGGTEPCMKDKTSGHCYQIFDTKITWNQAFYWCKRDGGNLVTIESAEEQQFIDDLMRKRFLEADGLWIGSDKLHPEEQRAWANGEQFSYVNWAQGEPNGPWVDENCAEIRTRDSTWNDLPCTELKGYICENSRATNTYIQDNTTGHWYKLVDAKLTWAEAFNICVSNGGMLMIIETAEEQKFIDDKIRNMQIAAWGLWIGSNKLHPENERTWTNGRNFTYANWAKGEPNNSPYVENCAEILTSNRKWNDRECTFLKGYICEKTTPVTPDSPVTPGAPATPSTPQQVVVISIAVGSALVLLVGVLLLFCFIQKRKMYKQKNDQAYLGVQVMEMNEAEHVYNRSSDLPDTYCTIDDNFVGNNRLDKQE